MGMGIDYRFLGDSIPATLDFHLRWAHDVEPEDCRDPITWHEHLHARTSDRYVGDRPHRHNSQGTVITPNLDGVWPEDFPHAPMVAEDDEPDFVWPMTIDTDPSIPPGVVLFDGGHQWGLWGAYPGGPSVCMACGVRVDVWRKYKQPKACPVMVAAMDIRKGTAFVADALRDYLRRTPPPMRWQGWSVIPGADDPDGRVAEAVRDLLRTTSTARTVPPTSIRSLPDFERVFGEGANVNPNEDRFCIVPGCPSVVTEDDPMCTRHRAHGVRMPLREMSRWMRDHAPHGEESEGVTLPMPDTTPNDQGEAWHFHGPSPHFHRDEPGHVHAVTVGTGGSEIPEPHRFTAGSSMPPMYGLRVTGDANEIRASISVPVTVTQEHWHDEHRHAHPVYGDAPLNHFHTDGVPPTARSITATREYVPLSEGCCPTRPTPDTEDPRKPGLHYHGGHHHAHPWEIGHVHDSDGRGVPLLPENAYAIPATLYQHTTTPGACADPSCPVLHADPQNPIHPPGYTPGGPMLEHPVVGTCRICGHGIGRTPTGERWWHDEPPKVPHPASPIVAPEPMIDTCDVEVCPYVPECEEGTCDIALGAHRPGVPYAGRVCRRTVAMTEPDPDPMPFLTIHQERLLCRVHGFDQGARSDITGRRQRVYVPVPTDTVATAQTLVDLGLCRWANGDDHPSRGIECTAAGCAWMGRVPTPGQEPEPTEPTSSPRGERVWCDDCRTYHRCTDDHGPDGHGGSSICCPLKKTGRGAPGPTSNPSVAIRPDQPKDDLSIVHGPGMVDLPQPVGWPMELEWREGILWVRAEDVEMVVTRGHTDSLEGHTGWGDYLGRIGNAVRGRMNG